MSVASAIMVTAMGVHAPSVEAKSLRLSSKKVTLTVGKSKTIKVRGAKKVTWKVTSGGKCIRLSNKKKTSVKITAKKAGSAKVQAKAGNKKISCKVTVKPAKNKKTTVLNVTKVDDATVKKVHETLSKGNTLKIRISGGKQSERTNTMDRLKVAVSKHNEYGVRPQLSSHTTKSYTEWEADSELAGQYKWGLLLVKDIVDSRKNDYINSKRIQEERDTYNYTEACNNKETELKNKYKYEGDEWKKTFEEVTGIPYIHGSYEHGDYSNSDFNYTDGQKAKTGTIETNNGGYYDWKTENGDYYWYTVNYDGKEYKFTDSAKLYTTLTGYEDNYEELVTDKNAYVYRICSDDYDPYSQRGSYVEVPASNITFHYEPLKVDLTAVDATINTKITTELNTFKESCLSSKVQDTESSDSKLYKLLCENKFCDLSSAIQQKILQEIMICNRSEAGNAYVAYNYELAASHGVKSCKGIKNPKGRIHGEGGAEGLELAYQKKWMGVCANYVSLEMTIYDLFDLPCSKVRCDACNHAWSVVKLTNNEGKTFYAYNNYGIKSVYKDRYDKCEKHSKTKPVHISMNVILQ